MKRCNVLGVGFSMLSYMDVMMTIQCWRENNERHYITLTPPHSVLMCRRDAALQQATGTAALTLPDGVGVILAAKLLRYPHCGRVSGPTLMLRLCDWGRTEGLRHFFYGGAPGVADALADRLRSQYPGLSIAGTLCPPFRELTSAEDVTTVRQINDSQPDIVWVGLGSPKQEKWMAEHVGRIDATTLIGVGAAFDFHSGRVKWAPEWMRRSGMEWVYRTLREPQRIGPKAADNLLFGLMTIVSCICRRREG